MRTKTLLLLAAAAAASTIATNAQVYSVNAVGYVNKTIPAKAYAMVANPLNGTDNKINTVLTGLPDGFQMYLWDTSTKKFVLYQYIEGAGWDGPNADTTTLNPGQGAFMRNPTANPVTITFVGEVPTGPLTTTLVPGLQIVSSQVPQAGKLEDLGFGLAAESATSGPKDGDQVYKWDGTKYVFDSYIGGAGWDAGLTFDVGEAFFLSRKAAGSWTRTFTIN